MPYIGVMKSETMTLTNARLEARLPNQVMVRLKRAAEIQGRSLTDFVVAAADEAACRAIEQTEVIRLSLEGQRQIAEAILNPPAPNKALKKAAKRYRELFGGAECNPPFLRDEPKPFPPSAPLRRTPTH